MQAQLSRAGDSSAALASVEPRLAPILAGAAGAAVAESGVSYPVADPRSARIFVPREFVNRIAVDMGVPVTALGDSYLAFRDRDYSIISAGQWILHIAAADGAGDAYAPFEIAAPAAMTRVSASPLRLVPVFVDPAAGIWLLRVEAA